MKSYGEKRVGPSYRSNVTKWVNMMLPPTLLSKPPPQSEQRRRASYSHFLAFDPLSNPNRKMARGKQKANAKKIRTDSSPDKENEYAPHLSTSGHSTLTYYLGHRRLQRNSASNPAILAIVLGLRSSGVCFLLDTSRRFAIPQRFHCCDSDSHMG